jgi:hypothetical protein
MNDALLNSKFLPPGLTGDDHRDALRKFVDEITGGRSGLDSESLRRDGNVSTWDFRKYWP